jgi:hypothetical protein
MKLYNHASFGLFLMTMADAMIWSALGILVGAILIWRASKWMWK